MLTKTLICTIFIIDKAIAFDTRGGDQKTIDDFNIFGKREPVGEATSYQTQNLLKGSPSPTRYRRSTKSPKVNTTRSTKSPTVNSPKGSQKGRNKLMAPSIGKSSMGKRGGMSGFGNGKTPSSSSSKGKGKGPNDSMSLKGKKKTRPPSTPYPTKAPTKAPSAMNTPAPVSSPAFETVSFTPYSLSYTLSEPRLPLITEVTELGQVTNTHLRDTLSRAISNLHRIETTVTDSQFQFGEPYEVFYDSTAIFRMSGPTVQEMDDLLLDAFSGSNLQSYLQTLLSLDNSIFNSTTEVDINEPDIQTQSQGSGVRSAGLIVGAIVGSLLVAGFAAGLHAKYNPRYGRIPNGEKLLSDGHITVAGDTCDESSLAQTSTYSAAVRFRDGLSVAGSHWATSVKAISECGSETEDSADEDTTMPIEDSREAKSVGRLDVDYETCRKPECADEESDLGAESEEEDVPMRVVDLIKMFSPMSS